MASQVLKHSQRLAEAYPWTKVPLVVSAPMRQFTGPKLALAVATGGGIGFIGPGVKTEATLADLDEAKSLLDGGYSPNLPRKDSSTLPLGVGFITWTADLDVAARAVGQHRPAAAWLFAPRNGQQELDEWATRFREVSPSTQIWVQVGTLTEALAAASSAAAPDVLVLQGNEAGGHGRAEDGIGLFTLLPEVADALAASGKDIPLVGAGGIADGRGVAAALGLGAAAIAMGTRFLASTEARLPKGYQDEVLRASDGASSTVRTQLYNHLRGTYGWPAAWSPRGVWNKTWSEHKGGVPFEELQKRHDEAAAKGDAAWGPDGRVATYAGASVGLVKSVEDAESIVKEVRDGAVEIIKGVRTAFAA